MRLPFPVVSSVGSVVMMIAAASRPVGAQGAAAPPAVVTSVVVKISTINYQGSCPAKLTFTGTINTTGVPRGPITYQWIRSDNAKSPKRTVTMTGTTVTVTEKWQVGRSGEHMRLWARLQVLAPTAITSNQADGEVLCH